MGTWEHTATLEGNKGTRTPPSPGSPSFFHEIVEIFKCTERAGVGDYSSRGEGDKENSGTVITSLQVAFTEHVVPATQAFDWFSLV